MRKLCLRMFACIMTVLVLCSCANKEEKRGILDEITGVWRAKNDGAMISLVYSDKKVRMFIGDSPMSVTLGDIDNENKTVNLNVRANDGKPGVWTIRQVWDKEHKSFSLQITLHDGTQDELTFVRKISTDDMNRFANADVRNTGSLGDVAKAPSQQDLPPASEPTPALNANRQNQNNQQADWAPSFDCTKVSNGPERLICSNKELAEADVQLDQIFRSALRRSPDKKALKQEQAAWLKNERNACSDAGSMLRAYQQRISQLSK